MKFAERLEHDEAAVDDLVRLSRGLFPHPGLGTAPYHRAVRAVVQDVERDEVRSGAFAAGLNEARARAASRLADLDDDACEDVLRALEGTPFFRELRDGVAWVLYDDREVWAFVGYPGASFELGGYVHRGFDDLDWLPMPRIEENPTPMLEVGPRA